MRRLLTIGLVATGLVIGGTTAQAATIHSTSEYKHHTLHFTYRLRLHGLEGMPAVIKTQRARHAALLKARKEWDRIQAMSLEALLAQAQKTIDQANQTLNTLPSLPGGGVPGWFASAMACISGKEEYGPPPGGHNTSAGYFGMIYPPGSYPAPGPAIAAHYGNSWYAIPYSEQLRIAYAEEQTYGWSPWTTAGACGLG